MEPQENSNHYEWLVSGDQAYVAMLKAMEETTESLLLETYTFRNSSIGLKFRESLIAACRRGVKVHVLVDFFGSSALPESFWTPMRDAGGDFRWFNPWNLSALGIRNHRKLLVCDRKIAFVGGFNIAPEFEGDGVQKGWRDIGLRIEGPLAQKLAVVFEDLQARAEFKHNRLPKLRKTPFNKRLVGDGWSILLSGPGRGRKHLKRSLEKDIKSARSVDISTAYFLPTRRLRRSLIHTGRRTGQVRLILPGTTDLPFTRMAAQCLYRSLLKSRVKIHEYGAQILHAKLLIVDDHVYIGSANLDHRSLNINYEILVCIKNARLAREARDILKDFVHHSRPIHLSEWKKMRPWWRRWLDRTAYFLLARVDPYLATWQLRDSP